MSNYLAYINTVNKIQILSIFQFESIEEKKKSQQQEKNEKKNYQKPYDIETKKKSK